MKPPVDEAARLKSQTIWGRRAATVLTFAAVFLFIGPFFPSATGFGHLADALGGETGVTRFFLAFVLVYMTVLIRAKNEHERSLHMLLHLSQMQLYGPDYREARAEVGQAIQRFLMAADGDRPRIHAELRELTGHDAGTEPATWQVWWATARHNFISRRTREAIGKRR